MQSAHFIVSCTVCRPVSLVHQRLKTRGLALRNKVTGPLPPENISRGISPWGTFVGLVSGKKVEKQTGLTEPPLLIFAPLEYIPKQLFGFFLFKK